MSKILVIGKTGQLALSLIEQADLSGIDLTCVGRPEMDLADSDRTYQAIIDHKPDILINAAAYTDVDAAEDDAALAYAINRDGTQALARAAKALDIPFLHVSTDYVYSGDLDRPYVETDATSPTGVYGASKLAGEKAALQTHSKTSIFRTAWVYSPYGKNFVKTMLWLGNNKDEVGIVADQVGNPTYARDFAQALLSVADHIERSGWQEDFGGLFHLAGQGEASWHSLALEIFEQASALRLSKRPKIIHALATAEYPTIAARPANSRLNCDKVAGTFGLKLSNWQSSLVDCLTQLNK